MTLVLKTVPGFSDLGNIPLGANKFSLGVHLSAINLNASFGLVRLETFTNVYQHGDTVPLPKSSVDGYTYRRNELLYLWVPLNTANKDTGWASYREPWTMWYGIWDVDQTTGVVSSEIGYRGNNDHKSNQATTNDGTVQVFVIAQRQKTGLIMSSSPAFNRHLDADFAVDKAVTTGLLTDMNGNAKYAVANTEVIYCGEFFNGQTVPLGNIVSPIDGHAYAYADCIFQTSMRWTADTDGSGNPIKPAINKGQLQDWSSSVTTSGVVKIANTNIAYELSGTHNYTTGKVAVFAFCTRALGTTFPSSVNLFSEIDDSAFAPGSTLRFSTLQQVNRNINQAICTPEFFTSTQTNGSTIALPTSPLDGYTYARSELEYVWDWANTGPSAVGSGRLSLVHGNISAAGVVTINDYRLNSGASSVALVHEGTMRVLIVAKRSATISSPPAPPVGAPAFGTDDVADFNGNLDDIIDGLVHKRPTIAQIQYLSAADGSISLSTPFNPQGSMAPNQTITLTFTMPSPGTVLHVTWLAQSLLRIDGSTLNLISSNATLGANLITDGDGESATVGSQAAGWTFDANSGLLGANDFFNSGTKSLKIVNGTAINSFSHQDISVTDGRVYSLRGWIKTTALPTVAGAGAVLNVDVVSGVSAFTIISKNTGGGVTDFKNTEPDIGLPADATARGFTFVECLFKPVGTGTIRVYCQLGYAVAGCSGSAWFDDVGVFPCGITYTGLSNSTSYYFYPYIEVATQLLKAANGAPPPTSPSDTFSQQENFDGRIGIPPKKIITPGAGSSGSDSGGGDGTCPEWTEPVTIRRYNRKGKLIFEGVIPAREVRWGFESDDGLVRLGDHIKGWSFRKNEFVWRAVHRTRHVHCSGWVIVRGRRVTPCEAVWWEDRWLPAWKTPGAIHDKLVSIKVDIEVEADWDDEHNYLLGDMIIHNTFILPC